MKVADADAGERVAKPDGIREPGVLFVLNDVPKGMDDEFTRWYHQEHLTERLALPGFTRARRYRSIDGQPNYMVVYDCDSVETLASAPYLDRLRNPTAWTRRIMPHFLNMERSACRESWSAGEGTGGTAIIAHCKPIHGREEDARRFIRDELGPRLMQNTAIVRMSLWETDAKVTSAPSTERDLRPGSDSVADWVLFIESTDRGQAALALHTHVLGGEGTRTGLLLGSWLRYQVIYERHAPAAGRR